MHTQMQEGMYRLLGMQCCSVFGNTYALYSVVACVVEQGCTPAEEGGIVNEHAPVVRCQRL